MNVQRRQFLAGIGGLAIAGASVDALAQAKPAVRLGHTAAVDYAPAWIAIERGYFAKRGLDASVNIISLNPMIPASLQSNSIDIGCPTASVLLQANDGGLDLVILAAASFTSRTSKMFGIVARSGAAVQKPSDLVGKKVGVPGLGALLHVLFRQWLTDKGIDYRQIQQVEIPLPQMNDALRAGNVDAVVLSEPMMSRITEAGNGQVLSYYTQELPDRILAAIYAARRDWAESNRAQVKAFREGLAEGCDVAKSDPTAVRDATEKVIKLPRQVIDAISFPEFGVEVTKADIDYWLTMMRAQNMLRTSISADKVLFP